MRSIYNALKFLASLVPATRTADADGTVIDTKGYNDGILVVSAGDIDLTDTNETYTVKIQEGDAANGSDMADVTGLTTTITADNQVKLIKISGLGVTRKRYLRAVLDVGGTTPSIAGEAVFVLGNAYQNPVQ